MNRELKVCEVCRLLDNDTRPKPCSYCPICNAWICDADLLRLDRRARAAIVKKLEDRGSNPL
jgi:hypothetical protein